MVSEMIYRSKALLMLRIHVCFSILQYIYLRVSKCYSLNA